MSREPWQLCCLGDPEDRENLHADGCPVYLANLERLAIERPPVADPPSSSSTSGRVS